MAARFVSTSRLGNIIQMITLSHQSGILRVIRGQGPSRELGQIRFVDGEPVSALLAQLTGNNALNVLMNWGECAYSFDEPPVQDMGEGDPGMFGGDTSYGHSPVPTGPATGSWPSYGYSNSNGGYGSSAPPSPSPLPSPYEQPGNGSYTGYPSAPAAGSYPGYPAGQPGPMPGTDYRTTANPMVSTTTAPSMPGLRPEMLRAVPFRLPISEHIDQLPLDRRERMVLLLIDGQRNIADLTRLTRRHEQDLYAVLMHLHMLGLIQFRA